MQADRQQARNASGTDYVLCDWTRKQRSHAKGESDIVGAAAELVPKQVNDSQTEFSCTHDEARSDTGSTAPWRGGRRTQSGTR